MSAMPVRSLEQRREALVHANEIRSARKTLKLDVKAKRVSMADVLLAPPAEVASMKVGELLRSVPQFGPVKTDKWLRRRMISPSKTFGGMTERQRGELASDLRT